MKKQDHNYRGFVFHYYPKDNYWKALKNNKNIVIQVLLTQSTEGYHAYLNLYDLDELVLEKSSIRNITYKEAIDNILKFVEGYYKKALIVAKKQLNKASNDLILVKEMIE